MRNKIIAIFVIMELILMLSFNLISYGLTNDENEIVIFKDENLKENLLKYDDNNDGELSVNEMKQIQKLYLQNKNITDLTGLEYATNLQELYLYSNNISNISVLSNLTNLTKLSLRENNISDISALTNLTNLTELNLEINNITDISSLSNLTELTDLYLYNNNINDISALTNLTKLTDLYLYNNNISDISALANLVNLTDLSLMGNNISDISTLTNLINLTDLNLSYNNISDISDLKNLTKLADLDLRGNSISDIGVLENLNISPKRLYLSLQELNIDLGNIEYGEEKEIELPKIFNQYSKYNPESEIKLIANYAYLNENKTTCILDTKITGNHEIYIYLDTIKLTITYNVMPNKGDINKDGKVSLYDAFTILRNVIFEAILTEEREYIMDFNDDGKVGLYDAFQFLRQVILS